MLKTRAARTLETMSCLFVHTFNGPGDLFQTMMPPDTQDLGARLSVISASRGTAVIHARISRDSRRRTHLVPFLSSVSSADYAYVASARCLPASGELSGWTSLEPVGRPDKLAKYADANSGGAVSEIDYFVLPHEADDVLVRFHIESDNLHAFLSNPILVGCTFGEISGGFRHKPCRDIAAGKDLTVPAKSQMLEESIDPRRVCSPACVSMVVDYFGLQTSVSEIASHTYSSTHDLYGIWPASLWAASKYGLLGYILRFEEIESLVYLIEQGLPVIASISYSRGELGGSAIDSTPGHLVVITGVRKRTILVNDPAAPDRAGVKREYDKDEFCNAWIARKGIGYVLFSGSV